MTTNSNTHLYREAVDHIVSLGFPRTFAHDVVSMDLMCSFEEHVAFILGCDADDITAWCGNGGPAR